MSSDLFDYIDWRGDLNFDVSPFNEVDAYLIAKLGSPDYSGIVPATNLSVSIADAAARYFADKDPSGRHLGALASPGILPMIRRLPETTRFSGLRFAAFCRIVDTEQTEQFSAMTVLMPDGHAIVTFRGTDDSMAGWKEDLLMSCSESVPAQNDALEYLRLAAYLFPGKLTVCGHSKGGNLAIFAAASVPQWIRSRIDCVYSFDAPGFFPEFYTTEGYKDIRDRIITLVPQRTIIGTFLFQDKEPQVVKCDRGPISCHDGFGWEVKGTRFVRCPSLTKTAETMDKTLDNVVLNMDPAERREFIDELFMVLTSTGAESISDLSEHKLSQALSIAKELKNRPVVRGFFATVVEETLKTLKK